jgi:hypothetical protein
MRNEYPPISRVFLVFLFNVNGTSGGNYSFLGNECLSRKIVGTQCRKAAGRVPEESREESKLREISVFKVRYKKQQGTERKNLAAQE